MKSQAFLLFLNIQKIDRAIDHDNVSN